MKCNGMLVFLAVLLTASGAWAQVNVGHIGVYADVGEDNCRIQDVNGLVTAYIVHTGAVEANTSQFRLVQDPGVNMTLLSATVNPALLPLGNIETGIVITYAGCKSSFPLLLATLVYSGTGTTDVCSALRIEADPALASGEIEVLDCSFGVHFVESIDGWVNSAGDCECDQRMTTVDTNPPGFSVTVDGAIHTAPRQLWDLPGTPREIGVLSPQGDPELFEFQSWSDGGAMTHTFVTPDANTTVTATFERMRRTTLDTDPPGLLVIVDGINSTAPKHLYDPPGTVREIGVVSNQGQYVFDSWSDGGAVTHSFTTPDVDTTVIATFTVPVTSTIDTDPPGLLVTVGGASYAAPKVLNTLPGTSIEIGVISPQGRFEFESWSDGGAMTHTVVVPQEGTTVVATFTAPPRTTLDTDPPGLFVMVDGVEYSTPKYLDDDPGTAREIGVVSPQGAPDNQFDFLSWSDGGAMAHTFITPVADSTVIATFELAPLFTVTTDPMSDTGLPFMVNVDGTTSLVPRTVHWSGGSVHNIGVPFIQGKPHRMFTFVDWSDGGELSHSVVAPGVDTTATATFELAPRFTIDTDPPGLDVTVDGSYFTEGYWAEGTVHTVSAPEVQVSDTTYAFSSWSDGGARTHDVTAPGTEALLTAYFVPTDPLPSTLDALVGIYTSPQASSCNLMDVTEGTVTVEIVHTGTLWANTSQFRIQESPGIAMTPLGSTPRIGLTLGNVHTGITITYGGCKPPAFFPLHLMTVEYLATGTSAPCSYIEVVGDPASASGQLEVIDCDFNVLVRQGGKLMVNGDASCLCIAPVEAKAKTWGNIKALYRK